MRFRFRIGRLVGMALVLLALLVIAQVPGGDLAAQDSALSLSVSSQFAASLPAGPAAVVDCADTGCPSGPATLDKCVERTDFCVYYTTASISETEAEWAADRVQDYWDRFVALGFEEPKHSGKLRVELSNITTDCNGGTGWYGNYITTYAACFDSDLMAQQTLGHELTHRVQYAHDTGSAPIQTKFLKEGTARATEDNWFTNIDHRTDALTADFSFYLQIAEYFASANNDITSVAMRYNSCLWWKYAMEQYGTTTTEPERGIDFVRQVYEQTTANYSGIGAVNQALSAMGAGTNFDGSFKEFAVANWAKDLVGAPGRYNYIDEDEPGNPAPYGPLVPEPGGTIQVGTDATWNSQWISRYGLRYYEADLGVNCPVVSATFHRDTDSPAFYHVITQDGTTFKTHVEGSGEDWAQAFLNDGITKVVAILGSLDNSSTVDLTLSCAQPVLDIKLPNSVAVAMAQPNSKFLVQVLVTNGAPDAPVVAGLTTGDFAATVGGVNAPVVGGGFVQEQYWLVVQAPASLSDSLYDLEITLDLPTGTDPADTNADSVLYSDALIDQVLVIDRSGSMGYGTYPRFPAAQDAASFYVDVTRDDDGLAVVPYHTDVFPAPFDMAVVDSSVRTNAKIYINDLDTGNATSIGDGLHEAVSQVAGSPTANALCSYVLLSDGMENTSLYWSDVVSDVVDSGCPVTAIAFGPESDETLMQDIATATGGAYYYNDVHPSTLAGADASPVATDPIDTILDLGSTYEYAEARTEGRQRLLAEKGTVSEKTTPTEHTVFVDETITEAVFSLDWLPSSYATLDLVLVDPDGNKYDRPYTFEDRRNEHVGYRVRGPRPGVWTMLVLWGGAEYQEVPYQVLVSGHTHLTLELLLLDRLGTRLLTGNRAPIYVFLTHNRPVAGAIVEALVTAPNGAETLVPLYDDGQHDDGAPNDGFYAGVYTLVTQASAVVPQGEDAQQPEPKDEGAYRVLGRAYIKGSIYREALGAFSVKESPDRNQNRLPDAWEEEYGVGDPWGDPDLDLLLNYHEFLNGTDPLDADTDDGGENDGSEVSHFRDPLDPADDGLDKPDFFQVHPLNAGVLLQFDVKPEYRFMQLYRSEGQAGRWVPHPGTPQIPPTGVYSDTHVENGQTYYYALAGVALAPAFSGADSALAASETITSAILTSEAVTPALDPVPPEALLIINGGDHSTLDLNVTLTFAPYESEGTDALEAFEDIEWMMLSNDPSFAGASWQPFAQGVPWLLKANRGEYAHVYARFVDAAENQSVGTAVGMIYYGYHQIYLPLVLK
ncbi:MAG: VWA domain-containing protein [Anaerolineae bacterium]